MPERIRLRCNSSGESRRYRKIQRGYRKRISVPDSDVYKRQVYWQAVLDWDSGNQDYAVSLYQNYLSGESPSHQDAYERVASYQISQENYDDALATLEQGIATVSYTHLDVYKRQVSTISEACILMTMRIAI